MRGQWQAALLAVPLLMTAMTSGVALGQTQQSPPAPANRQDALPSCYRHAKVPPPAQALERAYFLLIDQTTNFDASLKQTIRTQTRANLNPGTQFAIGTFSAFLDNRYTDVVLGGRTDAPLSQEARNDTGKTKLRTLDHCMVRQLDYAKAAATAEIDKAFGGASKTIARSDVFASLADFSKHVVAPGQARTKILLIASDMLENSSIASFYANRAVRRLDPASELQRVQQSGLLPDLAGVRVYVIGAGLLNTTGTNVQSGSYRDPQTMLALENFWTAYFKAAKAQLVEFGKPQLLRAIE